MARRLAPVKFKECCEGRHGACDIALWVQKLDEYDYLAYEDIYFCECSCHRSPIPDPSPQEKLYEPEQN